jgi:hypothetical protein
VFGAVGTRPRDRFVEDNGWKSEHDNFGYIEHCRRIGRRPGTVESSEMVGTRITTEMKAKPFDTLTGHDLDEFYGDLGKSLGANTIRQTRAVPARFI